MHQYSGSVTVVLNGKTDVFIDTEFVKVIGLPSAPIILISRLGEPAEQWQVSGRIVIESLHVTQTFWQHVTVYVKMYVPGAVI